MRPDTPLDMYREIRAGVEQWLKEGVAGADGPEVVADIVLMNEDDGLGAALHPAQRDACRNRFRQCTQEVRIQAWSRLARDLDLSKLARATHVVGLAEVPAIAGRMFEERVRGRAVVDVNA